MQLVIMMDPVQPTQIYEMKHNRDNLTFIKTVKLPQDTLEFIQEYSKNQESPTKVSYFGPDAYVNYFIKKANEFENVIASNKF